MSSKNPVVSTLTASKQVRQSGDIRKLQKYSHPPGHPKSTFEVPKTEFWYQHPHFFMVKPIFQEKTLVSWLFNPPQWVDASVFYMISIRSLVPWRTSEAAKRRCCCSFSWEENWRMVPTPLGPWSSEKSYVEHMPAQFQWTSIYYICHHSFRGFIMLNPKLWG